MNVDRSNYVLYPYFLRRFKIRLLLNDRTANKHAFFQTGVYTCMPFVQFRFVIDRVCIQVGKGLITLRLTRIGIFPSALSIA